MLYDALCFIDKQGIPFPDAINDNLPERIKMFGNNPRKVYADVYIDDHNAGGIVLPEIPEPEKKKEDLKESKEDTAQKTTEQDIVKQLERLIEIVEKTVSIQQEILLQKQNHNVFFYPAHYCEPLHTQDTGDRRVNPYTDPYRYPYCQSTLFS